MEKLAEGLEDTADFEDDAVAVTDESLTNNIKSFNSQDDEDDENDAVEVTDNLAQCGNEKNTTELCRSEEDVSKEFEVQQEVEDNERDCLLTFTNNFESQKQFNVFEFKKRGLECFYSNIKEIIHH